MRYKILLKTKIDESVLKEIKSEHSSDVEGISELYDQLIKDKTCESDKPPLIYYTAYTLSLRDIEMIIVRMN